MNGSRLRRSPRPNSLQIYGTELLPGLYHPQPDSSRGMECYCKNDNFPPGRPPTPKKKLAMPIGLHLYGTSSVSEKHSSRSWRARSQTCHGAQVFSAHLDTTQAYFYQGGQGGQFWQPKKVQTLVCRVRYTIICRVAAVARQSIFGYFFNLFFDILWDICTSKPRGV